MFICMYILYTFLSHSYDSHKTYKVTMCVQIPNQKYLNFLDENSERICDTYNNISLHKKYKTHIT